MPKETDLEYASMKDDNTIFFEKLDYLIIMAFVNIVPVSVLEIADGSYVFQNTNAVILGLDELFEFFDFGLRHL